MGWEAATVFAQCAMKKGASLTFSRSLVVSDDPELPVRWGTVGLAHQGFDSTFL
jgi:hypothetical protein